MFLVLAFSLRFPKKYFLPVFFIFSVNQVFSQQGSSAILNELDKKYAPEESIFSTNAAKKNRDKFASTDLYYGLQFLPFELTKGNLVFENEINIPNSCVNITLGLGYNIVSSYIDKNGLGFFDNNDAKSIDLATAINKSAYQKGGLYLSFGIKSYANNIADLNPFFSDGTPFNGLYSFFKIEHFSYSYKLPSIINNQPVIGNKDCKIIQNSLNYGIGYSFVTAGKIKTVHDFYIGMGLKEAIFPYFKQDIMQTYGPNGLITSYGTQYSSTGNKTNFGFSFTFGYSFGIGF